MGGCGLQGVCLSLLSQWVESGHQRVCSINNLDVDVTYLLCCHGDHPFFRPRTVCWWIFISLSCVVLQYAGNFPGFSPPRQCDCYKGICSIHNPKDQRKIAAISDNKEIPCPILLQDFFRLKNTPLPHLLHTSFMKLVWHYSVQITQLWHIWVVVVIVDKHYVVNFIWIGSCNVINASADLYSVGLKLKWHRLRLKWRRCIFVEYRSPYIL